MARNKITKLNTAMLQPGWRSGTYATYPPTTIEISRECYQCRAKEIYYLTSAVSAQAEASKPCYKCGYPQVTVRVEQAYGYSGVFPTLMPYYGTSYLETEPPKPLTKSTHNGVIIGFRYWKADKYLLSPIASGTTPWAPGINEAKCALHQLLYWAMTTADTTNDEQPHNSPSATCKCGFHLRAVPDPIDLSHAQVDKDTAILGACLAWGRCLMHGDAGFRAQYARPILLAYDPTWTKAKQGLVKGLAADYDCRAMPVSYPDVEAGVCEPLLQAAREYGRLMSEMDTTTNDMA